MSKRDMRAKKLLAAVLMALSMQVWYAPPIWAAEGGQTAKQTDTVTEEEQADATTAPAAGDSAKQETADAEAADTEQDAAANIKVPSAPTVRGYSISTLAAGDDYGIMPLAAGTNAYEAGGGDASGAYSVAIGSNTHAFGDYSIVLGSSAGAHAANSVAIGNESKAIKEYQVSFGDVEMNRTDTYHSLAGITDIDMIGKLNGANFTVDSHLSSIAIGTSAAATGARSTAFGYAAKAQGDYSLAFGYGATAANVDSIAIGGDSTTNADKQVSFGKYNIDTNSWSLTHSLAGIKDIEMTGELKGVTSINGKSIDSLGGGSVDLTNIETDINVKAVAKDGPLYNFSVERATGNITTAGTINGANFTVGDVTSKNIAVGIGATANLGSSAFGYNAKATGMEGSAFGNGATTGSSGSAFGNEANATGNYSSAFGDHAQATHEDSVAIGFWSTTTDTKQVSFGIGNVNADDGAVTWTKRRSLAGISAIDMEGALTGVTTINGANFTVDTANNSMAIGVGAVFSIDDLDFVTERSTVVGANAKAYDNDITLFGYDTYADYPGGVAFGSGALAESADAIAIGYQATASGTGSVAIGANSTNSTATENQVSFGTMGTTSTYRSLAGINNIDMTGKLNIGGTELYVTETGDMVFTNAGNKNIATGTGENAVFGYEVTVGDMSANTLFGNYAETNKEGATAIGFGAESKGEYSVALGALSNTSADYATTLGANSVAKNENSVAIGHESTTSAANQVSFGHKATDTDREGNAWGTELRRSLAGIKDIDMDGELKGVTKINGANFTVDTAKNSMAIGVGAATAHENSVAIGHGSITTEANQVSFGEGTVDPSTGVVTWSNIRNLAGIHDIAMEGALKGVTTINNAYFYVDESKKNMAVATGMFSGNNMTAFGDAINVSADYSSVFGSEATVTAKNSSAFGYKATATHDNSVAIGANSSTNAANQVSFGQISDTTTYRSLAGISDIDMEGALTGVTTINGANFTVDAAGGITAVGVGATAKWQGTAFGYNAQATGSINSTAVGHTAKALDVAGTAVGFSAIANGSNSTALGADTVAVNDYSVAIGYGSRATANNQVSFGDLLNNDTTTYRSLAGIKDITTIGALSTANGNFTVDASGNITKSGTINGATIAATKFNGVTIGTAGIGGINTFNGVMITPTNGITGTSIFNGVTLEKDASNHYKVGGVDVTQLETKTGGISRSGTLTGTDTGTTTIEGNTSISKAGGVATNKVTVSGGTTTTLENGKLTVGAATVQNTGFAVGSSSLANGSLTVGTGNTWTTAAGITATKGTIGGVTLSGNKVSGLTDATLSTNSTEAVTGKQLNATNQKVASAETDISTLQGKTTNISYVSGTGTTVDGVVIKAGAMTGVKSIDGIAVDSTTRNITNAGTYNGATIASSSFNGVTIGSGLVDGIDVSAMDTAYKAADKA
ncbi:beta strand repeat-containing protein, partial [Phascolarctobacterium sp.]